MVKLFFIILIILLPVQFALNAGENVDLVTTRLFIPAVFLFWLIKSLAGKRIWIPNKAETGLVISFLFLSTLGLFFGRDASAGFRKLIYFLTIFPVFFAAADIFREKKWRRRGVGAIFFSGMIATVIALIQFFLPFAVGLEKAVRIWENLIPYFLGNSFAKIVAANSSWLVNIGGVTRMRAFGFFPDPHGFAFFANLCFFTGLGYLFSQKRAISGIWKGAVLALMILAVALSFSRGAYLGLVAGAVFFTIIFLKRTGILGKAFAAGGLVLVLMFAINSNVISQRLVSSFNLKEGSNAERYKNWIQAVEIVRDNPLGGVGLGNYARTIDPSAEERSPIYAHNLFLDIAAETGILNAIVFLLLILFSIWRNIRNNNMTGLALASGLVGFFVHSIFDTALWSPQVLALLLVIISLGLYDNELKDPA